MKNNRPRRFLPTFMIAVTLYLFHIVPAAAAAETSAEPAAVSENALPVNPPAVSSSEPSIISENTLPAEPAVSENTLTAAPTTVSDNALPASPTTESDCISSAAELTDWLHSHMYSGGRARLTGNITMESSYAFIPYPNMPPLFVETDGYTIFVCTDVELWSDGRLTFSGTGNAQGVFHVEKGGSLLLDGVNVESAAKDSDSQYTLWQEEGASLAVGQTFASGLIEGNIHYADTPFVTHTTPVCVVVEQGQFLDGLLPEQVMCRVNYQGAFLEHEPIAVSWNMADTRKQQDARQRFQAQGTFSQAQSGTQPVCTVVYNDYPLTFTKAEAFIRGSAYTFRGDYIKQESALSAMTSPEYSFDGKNWIREGEHNTLSADAGFYISFPCDQWDTSAYPYIHIRLRADAEDQVYYSNVLRYTANHLDVEEDLGGSRGGGTNVVNPPANPAGQEKPDKPGQPAESEPPAKSDKTNPLNKQEESKQPGQTADVKEQVRAGKSENADKPPADSTTGNREEDNHLLAENTLSSTEMSRSADDYAASSASGAAPQNAVSEAVTDKQAKTAQMSYQYAAPAKQAKTLILATGFVLLSAAVGAVCFLVHTGTGSFQKRNSSSSGGTNR